MVDRNPEHTQGEGLGPFFSELESFENDHYSERIKQLQRAQVILGLSLEYDHRLGPDAEIKKRFVTKTEGTKIYPFAHYRIKLKPKDNIDSIITVAALRYPGEVFTGGAILADEDSLYVSWELQDGSEHSFLLDADAFSRLDLSSAFGLRSDTGKWPSLIARTRADEFDHFYLETVLSDFEPDLQTTKANLEI